MGAQEENLLSALLIYGYIGWLLLLHTALPKAPYGAGQRATTTTLVEISTCRNSASGLRFHRLS